MIWEWNDGSTNTKNHRRMNFAVSISYLVCFFGVQITQMHCDHGCFFFFYIQELNQTLLTTCFKVPLATIFRTPFFQNLLDVPLSHLQSILLDYVQGSLDSSSISAKSDFFPCKVTENRYLSFDTTVSSKGDEVVVKLMSITRKSNPVSIYKDFCLSLVQQICARDLLEFFDTPILKFVNNLSSI